MSADEDDAAAERARVAQLVLEAVASMARRSSRAQADLGAALRKVGIALAQPLEGEILSQLAASGLVENLIPLSDGAVLLTVTPKGLLVARHRG